MFDMVRATVIDRAMYAVELEELGYRFYSPSIQTISL